MPYPDITTNFSTLTDYKDRYRASHLNALQTAVNSIITAMPHKQQVVVVAKARGDYTALSSAAAAITDSSATKPYAILLMPGIYETSEVTLPAYVSLIGVDAWSCVLKASTPTSDNTEFVVKTSGSSLIANMTIINDSDISSTINPTCIYINGDNTDLSSLHIQNTVSRTSGTINASGVYINAANNNYFDNLRIDVTVPTTLASACGIQGVGVANPETRIMRAIINASGPTGGLTAGVKTAGTPSIFGYGFRIYECYVSANGYTLDYNIGWMGCRGSTFVNSGSTATVRVNAAAFRCYNCTITGSGALSITTDSAVPLNMGVAHCRFNVVSPFHANLTNLIATPYNVTDTDIGPEES